MDAAELGSEIGIYQSDSAPFSNNIEALLVADGLLNTKSFFGGYMIRSQRGAAAVEYALLMSILFMGLFSSTDLLNNSLQASLNRFNAQLNPTAPRTNIHSTGSGDSGTPPSDPNNGISGPGIIRTGFEGGESSTTNINGAVSASELDEPNVDPDGSRTNDPINP